MERAPVDYLFLLGRRTERLVLAGALLIGFSLFAYYLSAASLHFHRDALSRGLEDLALLIEGDEKPLFTFFDLERQRQKLLSKKKDHAQPTESYYRKALNEKIAKAAATSGANAHQLAQYIDASTAPADLVTALRQTKSRLDAQQGTNGADRLPSLISIQAGSTAYRVPSSFIADLLAIVLAPLIIAWMGALHFTRARERALMNRRELAPYRFPHVFNAVPTAHSAWYARRLTWLTAGRIEHVLAFVRVAIMCLLVAPLIGSYAATLLDLDVGNRGWLLFLVAIVVITVMVLQAAALTAAEAAGIRFERPLQLALRGEKSSASTM